MNRKKSAAIMVIVALCCAVMAVIDGIWQPDYEVKSVIKVALFLIFPVFLNRSSSLPGYKNRKRDQQKTIPAFKNTKGCAQHKKYFPLIPFRQDIISQKTQT